MEVQKFAFAVLLFAVLGSVSPMQFTDGQMGNNGGIEDEYYRCFFGNKGQRRKREGYCVGKYCVKTIHEQSMNLNFPNIIFLFPYLGKVGVKMFSKKFRALLTLTLTFIAIFLRIPHFFLKHVLYIREKCAPLKN